MLSCRVCVSCIHRCKNSLRLHIKHFRKKKIIICKESIKRGTWQRDFSSKTPHHKHWMHIWVKWYKSHKLWRCGKKVLWWDESFFTTFFYKWTSGWLCYRFVHAWKLWYDPAVKRYSAVGSKYVIQRAISVPSDGTFLHTVVFCSSRPSLLIPHLFHSSPLLGHFYTLCAA